jgi:hypothetical protein
MKTKDVTVVLKAVVGTPIMTTTTGGAGIIPMTKPTSQTVNEKRICDAAGENLIVPTMAVPIMEIPRLIGGNFAKVTHAQPFGKVMKIATKAAASRDHFGTLTKKATTSGV